MLELNSKNQKDALDAYFYRGEKYMDIVPKTYKTSYVLEKYDITRQTLYNWTKNGLISDPERDWRGWRLWTENIMDEIEQVKENKSKTNRIKKVRISKNEKLHIKNRRYLGSKYKLIPFIKDIVANECKDIRVFADIFGGTGIVSYAFNSKGVKVIVNDILYSNYLAYYTWLSNEEYNSNKIHRYINEFNNISAKKENYVSRNFGDKYFTAENARKIGAIREEIELISPTLTFREKAILITSLLYAMDKVANTCGHYDAFRRNLDTTQSLKLQVPAINNDINKSNEIYREDANRLVRKIHSDIVYIDTPYNSRQYSDAYHLLENIAKWEKPEVVGVAKKMIDRSHIKSKYCTIKAPQAFDDLVANVNSKYILVSYNNMAKKGNGRSNAKISDEEIIDSLKSRGEVKVFDTEHQYFTTGKTDLQDHRERLFLCKCK
ncbi:DNA adenine methylase [Proteiniborus sp. MB09-C3]|uniref:DNA adenine methylase n=1 Tax=Proteiniborus sp. MB09-C3 TaxID=3050072 RepID=UPI0025532969|nr:DNA adenine methylase [Proteiniborus sp. MB09-C3]WIV12454.1 DNA adenine methylase [Proteiniborus sp. MB09-C3]